jgi:uncharacterized oligopeptide transporter (OPT) family protein
MAEGVVAVTGVTLNPSSALAILVGGTILTTLVNWAEPLALFLVVSCAFATATASAAAAFSQSLTVGTLVGTAPVRQTWAMFLTSLITVPVVVVAAVLILGSLGVERPDALPDPSARDTQSTPSARPLRVPQASALYALADQTSPGHKFTTRVFVLGVLLFCAVWALGGNPILVGVGMILPLTVSGPLLLGGGLAQALAHFGRGSEQALKTAQAGGTGRTGGAGSEKGAGLSTSQTALLNAAMMVALDAYMLCYCCCIFYWRVRDGTAFDRPVVRFVSFVALAALVAAAYFCPRGGSAPPGRESDSTYGPAAGRARLPGNSHAEQQPEKANERPVEDLSGGV